MIQDDLLFINFLLTKLKEDLFNFQSSTKSTDFLKSNEKIKNLLKQSLFLLSENSQLLEAISKNNLDFNIKREILELSYNVLQNISTFYKKVEDLYPLFLDSVTVFFEPLSSKIEQVTKTLNNPDLDSLDTEEISYVLNEIIETLEVIFYTLQKVDNKLYN